MGTLICVWGDRSNKRYACKRCAEAHDKKAQSEKLKAVPVNKDGWRDFNRFPSLRKLPSRRAKVIKCELCEAPPGERCFSLSGGKKKRNKHVHDRRFQDYLAMRYDQLMKERREKEAAMADARRQRTLL